MLLPALVAALMVTMIPAATALPSCLGRSPTIQGTAGDDVLVGTPGPDVIVAGEGNDVILAGEGNDIICAGPGDDQVTAGPGDDYANGGRGNDVLEGEAGSDRLFGGIGNDRLSGGSEADILRGGSGDDTLDGGGGSDDLAGGPGADRLMYVLIQDVVSDAGTPDGAADTRWYQSLTLEPVDGTHVVFPNWVSGRDQHHTRPVAVRHAPGGLVLVERISPEEYLLGLGEMPNSWHPAALRAQAIAARSYLANLVAGGRWGVMAEFGFDICGSAVCQVYLGAGNAQIAEDGERWAAAVTATAGKILLYQGRPALALYHSTAGETTRSVQDVWPWSGAVPYLQAVDVPPQDSPFAQWSYELGLDQVLAILAKADITFAGPVTAISTTITETGGGPYRVRFETADGTFEVTADHIQSAMNTYGPALYGSLLPAFRPDGKRYPQTVLSPTFTMRTLDDGLIVRFEGQGWGHQLGLSQYGAQAMALQGSGTAAILNHFYTGLWPRPDPGFLPAEIAVGLGWDRTRVTLRAEDYVLRSPEGVVARGHDGAFVLTAGEGGMVVLTSP